jgi:hypothetical protein
MNEHQGNTDNVEPTFDKQVRLLDELQNMLAMQLHLARQGDSANKQFGDLIGKTGSLMDEIVRTGILDVPELRYRRQELRRQYESLCLIVAAQKTNAARELSRIHRGRKILETYRSNI